MKLYKVNNKYYVVVHDYGEVESYLLFNFGFNENIEEIELVSSNCIVAYGE